MSSNRLPPAQPACILRGHSAQIHALHFTLRNSRLLTADSHGWVISWSLASKRAVAVWKAHSTTVLGLGSWGSDRIITHGRDNQLLVWQLGVDDEDLMDKILPVEADGVSKRLPWLLHRLPVNSLNFCSFAMCNDGMPQCPSPKKAIEETKKPNPILVAVPNAVDSNGIDIYQLPSQVRATSILADRNTTTGMVMALGILAESTRIQVAAGYESGHTMVFIQTDPGAQPERIYCAQPHTQPVLSLSISPCHETYLTSSADATLAAHHLPLSRSIWKNTPFKPLKTMATKHSGQQGLSIRSDGTVFATAGWDGSVRVYGGKTMKEVAVLKWHREGCFATAFAGVEPPCERKEKDETDEADEEKNRDDGRGKGDDMAVARKLGNGILSVQQQRDEKARMTHWLAAGSKDGKVSLWDVY